MKKILFTLTTLMTTLLTGCQVDDLGNVAPGNSSAKGFSVSYHVNDAFSTLTKSTVSVEDGEDLLNSFYILFFEPSSGATGTFLDAVEIESVKQTPLRSSGTIDVTLPAELVNSKDYNILLLANVDKYSAFTTLANLKSECTGLTENDVIHTLLTVSGVTPGGDPVDEQKDNTKAMSKDYLPMSAGFVKKAGETNITVELIRAVSRFDVVCEAEGYELVSASVWNGFTSTPLLSSKFIDFKTTERTERYYGVSATNNKIVGSLYAFENYVSSPVQNDKKTTCLIIGLRKDGNQEVEYFRTNINNVQHVGQQIKRNNAYRTTIKSVSNRGGRTEREAYENPDNFIHYLEISPTDVPAVAWSGGTTEKIYVQASSRWTAELTIDEGNAGFNKNVSQKNISGENGDWFTVTFDELTTKKVTPCARITVKLEGKDLQETIEIYQEAAPGGILVWTNTFGVSTLARSDEDPRKADDTPTHREYHYQYVYDLGARMRDHSLFGANSDVYVPGGFEFMQGGILPDWVDAADVFQFVSTPNSSEITRTKNKLAADDKKFIIFSHKDAAVSNTLTNFKMNSGYTVKTYGVPQKNGFTFINKAEELEKPLIKYLTETGSFTKDRAINIDNIKISSDGTAVRGFSKWPATFTPIIVNTATGYCVFGIDVTQRFVWISDPSIFGSNVTTALNYGNYTDEKWDNQALLNNFIAWLARAVQEGESFYGQYRTGN